MPTAERWFIVWPDAKKKLGPLGSLALALEVRQYVETALQRVDLAVMTESELAR